MYRGYINKEEGMKHFSVNGWKWPIQLNVLSKVLDVNDGMYLFCRNIQNSFSEADSGQSRRR